MRIIGGVARGRRIQAPDGMGTRPMTDRARESTFNMVASLGGLQGATVLDLYAGSGSLGLEALSRGAAHVTFVEADRRAADTLRANLAALGFGDRAEVLVAAVQQVLPALPDADVAFCDPPYADDPWLSLLAAVPAPLVVAHTERAVVVPTGWEELRQRRYGRAIVTILERRQPSPVEIAGVDGPGGDGPEGAPPP